MKSYILNEAAFSSDVKVSADRSKNTNVVEFITTLQEADAPNRNGRIYPKKVLEEALKSPYVQERLRTKSFIGEANHPLDTSVQRQMTIDLRNAAFIIKEIWWEGNLVKGRCETCDTAIGRDMKGLIEQGVRVAFSLRANGNVHTDPISGHTIVDSPLNIATYDWIVVPSHSKAFMDRICEDTYVSMFRTNDRQNMVALCEAENFFSEGQMIEVEETQLTETLDYTKSFYSKYKKLSEMYFPEGDEEILSMNESEVVLKGNSVYKKVVLEDFLVKDIRNTIMSLTEEVVQPTHNQKLERLANTTTKAPENQHTFHPMTSERTITRGKTVPGLKIVDPNKEATTGSKFSEVVVDLKGHKRNEENPARDH